MPTCQVRGRTLYYQTSSSVSDGKTPVLFIHGSGGSAHIWSNQLAFEVPGYVHTALDLPGHARSQGSGAQSVADYASWVRDFVLSMGFSSCVLAGHSLGGAVAMMAALSFPELFTGVILVGTGAKLRVAPKVLSRARQGASFADYAYAPGTSPAIKQKAEKEFALTAPEVRYGDFVACDRFDILDRMEDIALPALIVCGEQDRLTPVKYAQYLHEHIPESRLEVIPRAGHMVMWEQPEACNRCLQDFLQTLAQK
ncbi:alpha/beta fold hydrolase [Desulfovermiculus halophilus]|uniref:alpha/beta fold hydrolase n=1 Tax=Desulfovermiculus halophilus TaxID=339722 RepID=UPI0004892DD8|nr:alpha/beta hydrolase [Desulfovermiculus halophilus]